MIEIVLNDLTSCTYIYNMIVGFYGFILFLYWAIKKGGASAWYLYVMVLLLSSVITSSFQLSARYFFLCDDVLYEKLLMSWLWAAKSWIASVVLTCIAAHASFKLFSKKYSSNL